MLFFLCVLLVGETALALSLPEYTNISTENAGKYNQLGLRTLFKLFLQL